MRVVVAAVVLALAYALVRYVGLGPVTWAGVPLYVANKAAALSGVALLAAALVVGPLQGRSAALRRLDRGALARAGGALTAGHALASLLLLGPTLFPDLFDAGRLTGRGELAMATGVVATIALVWQGHRPGAWARVRVLVLALAAAHATLIGAPKWLTPGTWHGGLPPITLLSVLVAAGALGVWLVARWRP